MLHHNCKRGLYYDITGLPVLINDNLINKVLFDAPNGFAFDVFTYVKAKEMELKSLGLMLTLVKEIKELAHGILVLYQN